MGRLRTVGIGVLRAPVLPVPEHPEVDPIDAFRDPLLMEALRIASPSTAEAIAKTLRGETSVDERTLRRQRLSAAGYLARASGRTTPFGMWAGVAPFRFGEQMTARWGNAHTTHSRPDRTWLDALIDQLHTNVDVVRRLNVAPHPTLVRRGERWERDTIDYSTQDHSLRRISTLASSFVDTLVERCKMGCAVRDLLDELVGTETPANTGDDRYAARTHALLSAVSQLLRSGVLVSNLEGARDADQPLAGIASLIESAENATLHKHLLAADRAITSYDAAPTSRKDTRLATTLQAMAQLAPTPRMHVDTALDARVTLPSAVSEELEDVTELLMRLFPPREGVSSRGDPLNRWHDAFLERYGSDSAIPLLEATDPHIGLGLPESSQTAPIPLPPHFADALSRLVVDAYRDGRREIELDDATVRRLVNATPQAVPASLDIGVELAAESVEDISRGAFHLLLPRLSRAAGGAALARFAPLLGDVEPALAQVVRASRPNTPGARYAEVRLGVGGTAGNMARSPGWLDFEIDVDTANVARDRISPQNLALTSDGERLHVWDVAGGELIPVTHSLVDWQRASPLARFLVSLGAMDAPNPRHWTWGQLEELLPWFPRVRRGRVVLAPETWRLPASVCDAARGSGAKQAWQEFDAWRESAHPARRVMIGSDEQPLLLDLDDVLHRELLRRECARRGSATLREAFVDEFPSRWLSGDNHSVELVVPLFREVDERLEPSELSIPVSTIDTRSAVMPGDRWLYARVAMPRAWQDRVLGMLSGAMRENTVDRWYFVRYRDGEGRDELRLRFRSRNGPAHDTLLPTFREWVSELASQRLVTGFVWDTYVPELDRYGGVDGMEHAERVFWADSVLAGELLGRGSVSADDRLVLAAATCTKMLLGFDSSGEAWRWVLRDRRPPPAGNARELQAELRRWESEGMPGGVDLSALERTTRSYGDWSRDGYESSVKFDERITQSLFHMHCNRFLGLDRDAEATVLWLVRGALSRRIHAG